MAIKDKVVRPNLTRVDKSMLASESRISRRVRVSFRFASTAVVLSASAVVGTILLCDMHFDNSAKLTPSSRMSQIAPVKTGTQPQELATSANVQRHQIWPSSPATSDDVMQVECVVREYLRSIASKDFGELVKTMTSRARESASQFGIDAYVQFVWEDNDVLLRSLDAVRIDYSGDSVCGVVKLSITDRVVGEIKVENGSCGWLVDD